MQVDTYFVLFFTKVENAYTMLYPAFSFIIVSWVLSHIIDIPSNLIFLNDYMTFHYIAPPTVEHLGCFEHIYLILSNCWL